MMAEDNRERMLNLRREVEELSAAGRRWGKRNYLAAYAVVILTVVSSGAAGAAAFLDQDPGLVGVLALMPGLLTLAATQLKLQARSNWHFKKRSFLNRLLAKIKYQTRDNPSAEELASLAEEFSRIEVEMEAEWQQKLNFDAPRADQKQG
jgi:hypothetical protein